MIKYEQLADVEWLRGKYCDEKKSLNNIAEIIGCPYIKVRSALKRHGIPIRTRGEGLRLARRFGEDYFIFNKSIVEGCLLGDGCLRKTNKNSEDSFAAFSVATIHYDHALWMAKQLFEKNAESRIKECANNYGLSKSIIFRLNSITHDTLDSLFKDWYPKNNNFVKVIPESLEINEIVLLHWYLGDGYSYTVKRKVKSGMRIRVQFATQSFCKSDLELLCYKIKDRFGLKMYPRFHQRHGIVKGTGYHIELSETDEQANRFFEIIGKPPISSMAYKWKYPK